MNTARHSRHGRRQDESPAVRLHRPRKRTMEAHACRVCITNQTKETKMKTSIPKSKVLALFGAGCRLDFAGEWRREANGAAYAEVSIEAYVMARRQDGREYVMAHTQVEGWPTAWVDYDDEKDWWGTDDAPGEGTKTAEAEIASACEWWTNQPDIPADIENELLDSAEELEAYASWRGCGMPDLKEGGHPETISLHKGRGW